MLGHDIACPGTLQVVEKVSDRLWIVECSECLFESGVLPSLLTDLGGREVALADRTIEPQRSQW